MRSSTPRSAPSTSTLRKSTRSIRPGDTARRRSSSPVAPSGAALRRTAAPGRMRPRPRHPGLTTSHVREAPRVAPARRSGWGATSSASGCVRAAAGCWATAKWVRKRPPRPRRARATARSRPSNRRRQAPRRRATGARRRPRRGRGVLQERHRRCERERRSGHADRQPQRTEVIQMQCHSSGRPWK